MKFFVSGLSERQQGTSKGFFFTMAILVMTSRRPTSVHKIASVLLSNSRTIYRKIQELEMIGCRFKKPYVGMFQLTNVSPEIKTLISLVHEFPTTTPDSND